MLISKKDMLFDAQAITVDGISTYVRDFISTGGAINTVSKLPQPTNFVDGTVSGVTSGGYRAEVDANGRQGDISSRIAAMYQDVPTADRDHVYAKRWGIAPSFHWNPRPKPGRPSRAAAARRGDRRREWRDNKGRPAIQAQRNGGRAACRSPRRQARRSRNRSTAWRLRAGR